MCAHSCRSLSQPRHSPAVVDQQHQQTPWSQTHSIHHCNGPVTVHSHAETSCPEKRNEAAASWPSPISRRRPDGRHLCRQHSPARPPPVRSTVCPWWCATVIPGGHTLWHAGGYVPGRPIYIQGRPGTLFGAPYATVHYTIRTRYAGRLIQSPVCRAVCLYCVLCRTSQASGANRSTPRLSSPVGTGFR